MGFQETDAPAIIPDMVEVILNGAWDSISSSEELTKMCSDLSLSLSLSQPEIENPTASPMLVEDDEEDLLGPSSPNPSLVLELEEGEASALLDTSIDNPDLTSSSPPSYGASDFRDRLTAEQRAAMTQENQEKEEARKARRRAKKAEKKKKAKKTKQQQKALLPQGTDWAKEKESDEAAKS